jgi:hypothetical protein
LDGFVTRDVDELSMPTFFEAWETLDRERRAKLPTIVVWEEISHDDEVVLSLPQSVSAPIAVAGNELIVDDYRIILKLRPHA